MLLFPLLNLPSLLLQAIDDTHQVVGMKYLRNKPVKDLAGADFLGLTQAETEGLLEMRISIDLDQGSQQDSRRGGSGLQSYFEEIRQLFYRVCMCCLLHLIMFIPY